MNKKIDKRKYKKALDFTYKIHFKQNRKGTGIPYFTHLVSVSNNIIEDGGTTDEAIGGLLHDAVEDQGGLRVLKEIKKQFGSKVAKIVDECSDTVVVPKPPWQERKKKYILDIKKKKKEKEGKVRRVEEKERGKRSKIKREKKGKRKRKKKSGRRRMKKKEKGEEYKREKGKRRE